MTGADENRGEQEDGSLNDTFGTGEYLDKNAMAAARSAVSSQGVNLRYLPVVNLVLAGFVVDAGPFFRWFNPMRLRSIEFKHSCIDAGFALPSHMSNLVTVSWPGALPDDCRSITIKRTAPQDVKTVSMRRKQSSTNPGPSGLKPKISSILTRNWFSTARAHSLKTRKANKERQQRSGEISHGSSSSNLTLSRPRSSSGLSWKSHDFVPL
jgi:hypothetical protein